MEKKHKILLKLFISTFYLSAFTFGGGYVIVTLMKKKFVDQYHWIEEPSPLREPSRSTAPSSSVIILPELPERSLRSSQPSCRLFL